MNANWGGRIINRSTENPKTKKCDLIALSCFCDVPISVSLAEISGCFLTRHVPFFLRAQGLFVALQGFAEPFHPIKQSAFVEISDCH